MDNILETFLDELEVRHTHAFASRLYNEHPHRNDMLGLKMMLSKYGIESIGVKYNDKRLEELVYPCILHINGGFVIGKNIDKGILEYIWKGRTFKKKSTDFNSIWTGNTLIPRNMEKAAEPNFKFNQKREFIERGKYVLLLLLPLILTLYGCIENRIWTNIIKLSAIIIHIAGYAVCILLMQKQLFKESRPADRICSLFHQKDCNNVLLSDKAKVLDTFSWSEIGISYFIITSLFLALSPSSFTALSVIGWSAMPYGIWSVWYQYKVIRQWCILCVVVQILIWFYGTMTLLYFFHFTKDMGFTFNNVLIYNIAYISIFIILALIVVHLITEFVHIQKEYTETKQRYNAAKSDKEMFIAKLHQKEMYLTTDEDSSIIMGPRDAELRITVLTNPHCNPCALMHERIKRLLSECKNHSISVQYIMSAFNDDLQNSNRFLIAIYQQMEYESAMKVYDLWYKKGRYHADEFFSKWNIDLNTPEVKIEMEKHRRWKERTKLVATPTLLINGFLFPDDIYEIEDIVNFNCATK